MLVPKTSVSPIVSDWARLSRPAAAGQRQHVAGLRIRRRRLVERAHVAAEDRVVGALLEVHAADRLPLLAVGGLLVRDLAALVVGRGRYDTRFSAAGLKQRGIDPVVDERRPQLNGVPPLHAAEAYAVKSPRSMAAVGTNAMLPAGVWWTLVPW